jgi:hypothetical protein
MDDDDTLVMLGINPANLSPTDKKQALELARRISACDNIPGAAKRRTQALTDWQKLSLKWRQRKTSTNDSKQED